MHNDILYASSAAWVLVNILQPHRFFKVLNRKPFACDVCMAGWISLILSIGVFPWYLVPFRMSMAMILTILIGGVIRKL